jgi:selenide,water dikinase
MATLNLEGARIIQKFDIKACTDVTGFGILGHAKYLA